MFCVICALNSQPLLEIIANSDWRRGLKYDYNQEATLVRGARPS